MSESFADLFEESLRTVDMQPGAIVTGVVIDIDNEWVTVHAGLKSIPRVHFTDVAGECSLSIGDEVQVTLETVEDGFGQTKRVSKIAKLDRLARVEDSFGETKRVSKAGLEELLDGANLHDDDVEIIDVDTVEIVADLEGNPTGEVISMIPDPVPAGSVRLQKPQQEMLVKNPKNAENQPENKKTKSKTLKTSLPRGVPSGLGTLDQVIALAQMGHPQSLKFLQDLQTKPLDQSMIDLLKPNLPR